MNFRSMPASFPETAPPLFRHWRPDRTFVLVTLLVVAVAAALIDYAINQKYAGAAARLNTIAELNARQLADWLQERRKDTAFLQGCSAAVTEYRRWRQEDDGAALRSLQDRLRGWTRNIGFNAITLYDHEGELLWHDDERGDHPPDERLKASIDAALLDGKVRAVGPIAENGGRMHLHFIARLGAGDAGPAPLVLLHVELEDRFNPKLQHWPEDIRSGDIVLLRRDGDSVLFLNTPRYMESGRKMLPLNDHGLLATQVASGKVGAGGTAIGRDYRGIPVIGVAHPVAGTNWYLLAKLDLDEVRAAALPESLWIGLSGLLGVVMTAVFSAAKRRRRLLAIAASKLSAQQQVAAAIRKSEVRYHQVVDNLEEVVFQTDIRGQWTFLNPAWMEITGFPVDTSLGTPFFSYVHPDDRQRSLAQFESLIRRKQNDCRYEVRYSYKNGGFGWIEVWARLTLDENGSR